jgi:hypothetical protein
MIKKAVLSAALVLAAMSTGLCAQDTYRDYGFEQERMVIQDSEIYLVSSFDDQDHVTAYNFFGQRLWNRPFFSKIMSWEVHGELIMVFSKDRKGKKTYLTCLNRSNGYILWERP